MNDSLINSKVDLLIELDYLGYLEIESKYIQTATIQWLIAQVKLFEVNKRALNVYLELNVQTNSFNLYRNLNKKLLIEHRLSNLFKLCSLNNDLNCFGYFYRVNESFDYVLHVFRSKRSNLAKAICDLQSQAIKLHENFTYEKIFDFVLIAKLDINKEELNIPNFIELFLDKLAKHSSFHLNRKEFNKHLIDKNRRVLLKFAANKLYLEQTDEKCVEQEYRNVLYLNNSITNENYFCLSYNSANNEKKTNAVALILYTENVELIDDVIREYAMNVSSELSVSATKKDTSQKGPSLSIDQQQQQQQHTCIQCPMQQFVDLCEYLNNEEKKKANFDLLYDSLIDGLNKSLDLNDQNYLYDILNEKNLDMNCDPLENLQLIVALIHKLCRKKQCEHLIFHFKQKNNLNFEMEKKFELMKNGRLLSKEASLVFNFEPKSVEKKRLQRSNTIYSVESKALLDIVTKSNNLSKENLSTNNNSNHKLSISRFPSFSKSFNRINNYEVLTLPRKDSIRRSLYSKIMGPPSSATCPNISESVSLNNEYHIVSMDGNAETGFFFIGGRFKSKSDVRQFWKKIISEQILLNKMEKENNKLKTKAMLESLNSISSDMDTMDHNYVEITPCLKEVDKTWESMLGEDFKKSFNFITCENEPKTYKLEEIRQTLYKGVPQVKRGKIWYWLVKQFKLNTKKNVSLSNLKNDLSYEELLKQTTIHQHSILLDLGRTFPNHPNFTKKFGAGQLALFNVLKAYSIMDNEVGYCQGLSFIVGILLVHVNNNEKVAFELLKFLLIDLNLREQYKPDMTALQKHMYQLSRLLHDKCTDIYYHLEENEISTSLYAAPWFLTLYSSQFQMGFVARVFDFLFAEGPIVLFKISLAILSIHKPILLTCISFETVVDHIKTTIPEMSLIESELIMNKAFNYDIEKCLTNYEIEFNILSEEFETSQVIVSNNNNYFNHNNQNNSNNNSSNSIGFDEIRHSQLESENFKLKTHIKELNEKLKICRYEVENQEDALHKLYHENKQLKCKVDTLEIEREVILKKVKEQEKLLKSRIIK